MTLRRFNIKFNPEESEQIAVIDYIKLKFPGTLVTIPPQGMKLSIIHGYKLKRMGYMAGTTDILILEARKGYHGLLIEMKVPERRDYTGKIVQKKGILSSEQINFIRNANDRGYKALCCYGYKQAIKEIEDYFNDKISER